LCCSRGPEGSHLKNLSSTWPLVDGRRRTGGEQITRTFCGHYESAELGNRIQTIEIIGAPEMIRTSDLCLRRATLDRALPRSRQLRTTRFSQQVAFAIIPDSKRFHSVHLSRMELSSLCRTSTARRQQSCGSGAIDPAFRIRNADICPRLLVPSTSRVGSFWGAMELSHFERLLKSGGLEASTGMQSMVAAPWRHLPDLPSRARRGLVAEARCGGRSGVTTRSLLGCGLLSEIRACFARVPLVLNL
jgi:hypothetical protein